MWGTFQSPENGSAHHKPTCLPGRFQAPFWEGLGTPPGLQEYKRGRGKSQTRTLTSPAPIIGGGGREPVLLGREAPRKGPQPPPPDLQRTPSFLGLGFWSFLNPGSAKGRGGEKDTHFSPGSKEGDAAGSALAHPWGWGRRRKRFPILPSPPRPSLRVLLLTHPLPASTAESCSGHLWEKREGGLLLSPSQRVRPRSRPRRKAAFVQRRRHWAWGFLHPPTPLLCWLEQTPLPTPSRETTFEVGHGGAARGWSGTGRVLPSCSLPSPALKTCRGPNGSQCLARSQSKLPRTSRQNSSAR